MLYVVRIYVHACIQHDITLYLIRCLDEATLCIFLSDAGLRLLFSYIGRRQLGANFNNIINVHYSRNAS